MDDKNQNHPAQGGRSPEGGAKDTDTRKDIAPPQRQDMLDKGEQVEQTPKDVTGEHDAAHPQKHQR